MALMASAIPPPLRFQIQILEGQRCPLIRCSIFSTTRNRHPQIYCIKVPTISQYSDPSKVKMYVDNFKEKLCETFPQPVKEFPWKKAENIVLHRLLFLGEKALKWSLITLFIVSSFSDVIFSISRNRELTIPLGLFVGCTMADFLKETSQELFPTAKERGSSRHLLGVAYFFILVKFISVFFTVGGQSFLSHVGNGGLMQILWLWRKLLEERDYGNEKGNSSGVPDASMSNNVQG
ncbi:hypothetical protein HHK36_008247 [Tetracentron sinense]|uniref:Uncharacterized protein n=1 Tax=Tetracentron sinense TaxID=13715 RepID=A0A834ZGA3_TETSI|nr:hypothetical protein HHK36_008247 [Tetracentron sinense]